MMGQHLGDRFRVEQVFKGSEGDEGTLYGYLNYLHL